MAQSFFPITPVEVTTATTGSWQKVSLAAYIPAGATGVLLHIVNNHASQAMAAAVRHPDSTDDFKTGYLRQVRHTWAAIGIDASRQVGQFIESTDIDIWLVGYTGAGVTFLTNSVDKSGAISDWRDMDCAAQAHPATMLIFQIEGSTATTYNVGVRCKGSTDARYKSLRGHECYTAIVGCDANHVAQSYRSNTAVTIRLIGYITDGATAITNATDKSIATTGAWTDLAALPATAGMGFFEIHGAEEEIFGLRKNGTVEDIYRDTRGKTWAFVECDASQLVEMKISATTVDVFLTGWAVGAPPVTFIPKITWS